MAPSYLVESEAEAARAAERLVQRGHRLSWVVAEDGVHLTVEGPPTVEVEEVIAAEAPSARTLDLNGCP